MEALQQAHSTESLITLTKLRQLTVGIEFPTHPFSSGRQPITNVIKTHNNVNTSLEYHKQYLDYFNKYFCNIQPSSLLTQKTSSFKTLIRNTRLKHMVPIFA